MKYIWQLLAISLLLSMVTPASASPEKEWTILFFLNGDNDLDDSVRQDIEKLKKVGSSDQVNLLVLQDGPGANDTQRHYVEKNKLLTENIPEANMGNWRDAVNFFKWGAVKYPARHFMFLMSDHGSGWRNDQIDNSPASRQISLDSTSHSVMSTLDLGEMSKAMHEFLGRKVDILAYSACLMGMVEVAYETHNDVDFVVFSEDITSAFGWPFSEIFSVLHDDPNILPKEFTKIMAQKYAAWYSANEAGMSKEILSSLEMSRFAKFANDFNDYINILRGNMHLREKLRRAFAASRSFSDISYRDLYNIVQNISKMVLEIDFHGLDKRLLETLKDGPSPLIIASEHPLFIEEGAEGAAIFVPSADEYTESREEYLKLKFGNNFMWHKFLDEYFNPPVPVLITDGFKVTTTQGSPNPGPGENLILQINLSNQSSVSAENVRITVSTADNFLELKTGQQIITQINGQGTATSPGIIFSIAKNCPHLHQISFKVTIHLDETKKIDEKFSYTVREPFTPKNKVLLLVDDALKAEAQLYFRALQDAGYVPDIWEFTYHGKLTEQILAHYNHGLVFFAGIDQHDALKVPHKLFMQYLNSGGSMLVMGQHLGKYLKDTPLYKNYFQASFMDDQAVAGSVCGLDQFSQHKIRIAPYQDIFSPDLVASTPGANLIFKYGKMDGCSSDIDVPGEENRGAGIFVDQEGYKLIYLAFSLETITAPEERVQLLKNVISHCLGAND